MTAIPTARSSKGKPTVARRRAAPAATTDPAADPAAGEAAAKTAAIAGKPQGKASTGRRGAAKAAARDAAAQPLRKGRGDRLTADDWIAAGQDILREDGIAGLKLMPLTRRLGVSTGSFYHHFADFEDYLGALADHYSLGRVQSELDLTIAGETDPVERIKRLGRTSIREGTFELDRAMRIWATMDPRAERTVQKGEALVLAFLEDCFRELGFPPREARLRASILLSVNVAPLGLPQGVSRTQFLKDCLRLLSGRADAQDAPEPEPAPKKAGRRKTAAR